MRSAFGIEHGDVSKAMNPIKGIKAFAQARKAKAAVTRTTAPLPKLPGFLQEGGARTGLAKPTGIRPGTMASGLANDAAGNKALRAAHGARMSTGPTRSYGVSNKWRG